MKLEDALSYALLAAVVAAVLFARRRGKQKFQAAIAAARADAAAAATAEARSAAVASNVVHVGTAGLGNGATDGAASVEYARYVQFCRFLELDRMRSGDGLDRGSVGELQDVTRHGAVEGNGEHRLVLGRHVVDGSADRRFDEAVNES